MAHLAQSILAQVIEYLQDHNDHNRKKCIVRLYKTLLQHNTAAVSKTLDVALNTCVLMPDAVAWRLGFSRTLYPTAPIITHLLATAFAYDQCDLVLELLPFVDCTVRVPYRVQSPSPSTSYNDELRTTQLNLLAWMVRSVASLFYSDPDNRVFKAVLARWRQQGWDEKRIQEELCACELLPLMHHMATSHWSPSSMVWISAQVPHDPHVLPLLLTWKPDFDPVQRGLGQYHSYNQDLYVSQLIFAQFPFDWLSPIPGTESFPLKWLHTQMKQNSYGAEHWVCDTLYLARDVVVVESRSFYCTRTHLSGATFDVDSSNWIPGEKTIRIVRSTSITPAQHYRRMMTITALATSEQISALLSAQLIPDLAALVESFWDPLHSLDAFFP